MTRREGRGRRARVHGRLVARAAALVFATAIAGCAARAPAATTGSRAARVLDVAEGLASFYGPGFHGQPMASGIRFDMNAMVAAHPSYPFGTEVRVTNLENGRSVQVTILDRGPAARIQADGVIIDLSRGAAARLGFIEDGRVRVRVEVLSFGEPDAVAARGPAGGQRPASRSGSPAGRSAPESAL